MKLSRKRRWPAVLAMGAMITAQAGAPLAIAGQPNVAAANDAATITPITHVIVVIGENHTFDNIFATYKPEKGQTILNLLSAGIIDAKGAPGPNAAIATQFKVNTPLPSSYFINVPGANKTEYTPFLPTPQLSFAPNKPVSLSDINSNPTGVQPPFDKTVSTLQLQELEPSLELGELKLLRTGATGAAGLTGDDTRVTNATTLPNTVFQWTGKNLPYDAYQGDQVHRLFHMWQQSDCDVLNSTKQNPSGCLNDLYPFVGIARDDSGSNAMGFFNVQSGDAPLLNQLAHKYAMSDNFHQSVMGGTAANHVELGAGDAISWSTFGSLTTPPSAHVANPNPVSSTSDKYTADKEWTNCSDTSQPGIQPIVSYLAKLPYKPKPNCASGAFYMINNLSPGFLPNGTIDTASINTGAKVPPSTLRTIGDELNANSISWAYYGGGYDAAVRVANGSTAPFDQLLANNYCDICNFESYATSIMGSAAQRSAHIKDASDFFFDLAGNNLPAVSFVKPDGFLDGHPASSKLDLFEGMVDKIYDSLKSQPALFKSTALIVTFDEGGGSWDSGYMQPLDFFGDGPRIPLIVISPYSRGGRVVHTYTDHVSILKFIERNWGLTPLTTRSRDNFLNPTVDADNPYVPTNSPAIGDLFDMFEFP